MVIAGLLLILLVSMTLSKKTILHTIAETKLGKAGLLILVILFSCCVNKVSSVLFALVVIMALSKNLESFTDKFTITMKVKKEKKKKTKKSQNDQLKVDEDLKKAPSSNALMVSHKRGNNHTNGHQGTKEPSGTVCVQSKASVKEGFFY